MESFRTNAVPPRYHTAAPAWKPESGTPHRRGRRPHSSHRAKTASLARRFWDGMAISDEWMTFILFVNDPLLTNSSIFIQSLSHEKWYWMSGNSNSRRNKSRRSRKTAGSKPGRVFVIKNLGLQSSWLEWYHGNGEQLSETQHGCVWKWGIPPKCFFWWEHDDESSNLGVPYL